MDSNLYWSVYQNIEREVIDLSEKIHIDDNQLDVYSIKIAELLIRCVVEIESIVKELYFGNGGTQPEHDKDLYFDTDCIRHLENLWKLSKKHILVVAPNFYFEKEENKVLTPFHKAFKRGTSSSDWQKAYQAVKHDRAKNLKKGNLRNLIRALSALYLANIYFKNLTYQLGSDSLGDSFDSSLGSNIFAIKLKAPKSKSDNLTEIEECTYFIAPSPNSLENFSNFIDLNFDDKSEPKYTRELVEALNDFKFVAELYRHDV